MILHDPIVITLACERVFHFYSHWSNANSGHNFLKSLLGTRYCELNRQSIKSQKDSELQFHDSKLVWIQKRLNPLFVFSCSSSKCNKNNSINENNGYNNVDNYDYPRYLPPWQRKANEKQSTTWAFSFTRAATNKSIAFDKNWFHLLNWAYC